MGTGKRLTALAIYLFACVLCARASGPAVLLAGQVDVRAGSIYLSDLLPDSLPPVTREAAQHIRVAPAPLPGQTITLSGEKIAALLEGERSLRSYSPGFDVPSQIVVRRAGHRISHEEVAEAIAKAVSRNSVPENSGLNLQTLSFEAPVIDFSADAKLEVRRMDFDPALKQARFLVACDADKRIPPFLVTAQLQHENAPGAAPSPALGIISVRPHPSEQITPDHLAGVADDSILLVQPGKRASLHVVSGSMQLLLQVVPLDRGTLGQTVRVRLPGNGKVLRGRVVSAGRLEAEF